MRTVIAIAITVATIAAATAADARPHRVCHIRHGHRVCHIVR